MAHKREEVPELEKMLQYGRKKFVRYDEGAKLYSMGLHTFQNLAKDAGAVYRIKGIVLVNTELVDEYLEAFKEDYNKKNNVNKSAWMDQNGTFVINGYKSVKETLHGHCKE